MKRPGIRHSRVRAASLAQRELRELAARGHDLMLVSPPSTPPNTHEWRLLTAEQMGALASNKSRPLAKKLAYQLRARFFGWVRSKAARWIKAGL